MTKKNDKIKDDKKKMTKKKYVKKIKMTKKKKADDKNCSWMESFRAGSRTFEYVECAFSTSISFFLLIYTKKNTFCIIYQFIDLYVQKTGTFNYTIVILLNLRISTGN